MIKAYQEINAIGKPVEAGSPYSVGKEAREWNCDGCGCTGQESDSETWSCPCSCHDGWKFIQDGGRFRSQVDLADAGLDLRSGSICSSTGK